jgi:hypothetical protein
MSQGKSLYSYKNVKFFSFTKSENRRAEQVLSGVLVPVREEFGERVQEGEYGTNTVYTSVHSK